MNPIDQLAEARIQEAIDRGELRGLPGEGRPLQLDDDSAIPEELRAAYRLLKNAGFLPPELRWNHSPALHCLLLWPLHCPRLWLCLLQNAHYNQ